MTPTMMQERIFPSVRPVIPGLDYFGDWRPAVAVENRLRAAVSDVAPDEGGLGGIVVVRGESGQVAPVPCRFGLPHHGANLVALGKQQGRAEKQK